jgi:hypothetical protein
MLARFFAVHSIKQNAGAGHGFRELNYGHFVRRGLTQLRPRNLRKPPSVLTNRRRAGAAGGSGPTASTLCVSVWQHFPTYGSMSPLHP